MESPSQSIHLPQKYKFSKDRSSTIIKSLFDGTEPLTNDELLNIEEMAFYIRKARAFFDVYCNDPDWLVKSKNIVSKKVFVTSYERDIEKYNNAIIYNVQLRFNDFDETLNLEYGWGYSNNDFGEYFYIETGREDMYMRMTRGDIQMEETYKNPDKLILLLVCIFELPFHMILHALFHSFVSDNTEEVVDDIYELFKHKSRYNFNDFNVKLPDNPTEEFDKYLVKMSKATEEHPIRQCLLKKEEFDGMVMNKCFDCGSESSE